MNKRAAVLVAIMAVGILLYALLYRPGREGLGGFAAAPGQAKGIASPLTPDPDADRWAEKTLAGLSLERKVGQLLCVEIAGGYIAEDDPRLAKWIGYARDLGVGGMVLYGGTPRDVAHLLNRLQREA